MNASASPKKPTIAARKTIKATDRPLKLTDRDGLYLHVAVAGSKVWHLAYRFDDKQRVYKIGPYPQIDLDEARDIAHEQRKLVVAGIDPREHAEQKKLKNQASQQSTLWSVCVAWLEHRDGTWAPRTGERARRFLERYVKDGLGQLPVASVDAGMIHNLLTGIAKGTIKTGKERRAGAPTVALAIRQSLNEVFRFAIGTGRATVNPVTMMRAADSVKRTTRPRHNRALNAGQLRELLVAVDGATLTTITRAAVRLLFLTAVRTGELIGARWTEIDLETALWTIPPHRMKGREEHVVPLSVQAVALLRDLHQLTGTGGYVFPNYRDDKQHMGNTSLTSLFVRLGFVGDKWFRGHGVRGTFSTWANELDIPADHVERSLAHRERNAVRLAYNSARWLPQRRALMQRWADALDALAVPEQDEQEPLHALA